MKDLGALVGIVVLLGTLWWLYHLIDPHWASNDGRRCVTSGQRMFGHSPSAGYSRSTARWKSYRVAVDDQGAVRVRCRHAALGHDDDTCLVLSESTDSTSRRRVTFVLKPIGESADLILLRVPSTSRAVPVFRALIDRSVES